MWLFFVNSVLLGVGLAMDAFSVSLANGLAEPHMKVGRMSFMAGIYGFFQFAMPLIGWICVHTLLELFVAFEPFIPWIALGLLLYIGINMIRESGEEEESKKLSLSVLLMQGVATSIDALSVGFTIANETLLYALISCIIIGLVTFVICIAGLALGKSVGTHLSKKAMVFGGWVLILIGVEIFIRGVFF